MVGGVRWGLLEGHIVLRVPVSCMNVSMRGALGLFFKREEEGLIGYGCLLYSSTCLMSLILVNKVLIEKPLFCFRTRVREVICTTRRIPGRVPK